MILQMLFRSLFATVASVTANWVISKCNEVDRIEELVHHVVANVRSIQCQGRSANGKPYRPFFDFEELVKSFSLAKEEYDAARASTVGLRRRALTLLWDVLDASKDRRRIMQIADEMKKWDLAPKFSHFGKEDALAGFNEHSKDPRVHEGLEDELVCGDAEGVLLGEGAEDALVSERPEDARVSGVDAPDEGSDAVLSILVDVPCSETTVA